MRGNAATSPVHKPTTEDIAIGHDILALISSAMYTEPLTIYRELVQNATDAIDDAVEDGKIEKQHGVIQIAVDGLHRSIVVRDNGSGVPNSRFAKTMCSIGASRKRGSKARGFRGIGRLVGLGYCQELIFRSRSEASEQVYTASWDCRRLREELRAGSASSLVNVIANVVSISKSRATEDDPARFFEVELRKVVRLASDGLLNPELVAFYLGEVAPVEFEPAFKYGKAITEYISSRARHSTVNIEIAGHSCAIVRPYTNKIELSSTKVVHLSEPTFFEVPSQDGEQGAIGWICHHEYLGAFPRKLGIRGLRARVGNLQIGEDDCLDYVFPEHRFNQWTTGEVHIVDDRIVPNGRRDDFEPNVHYENLCNHLMVQANDISSRCRSYSLLRRKERGLTQLETALNDYRKLLLGSNVAKIMRHDLIEDVRTQIDRAKRRLPGKENVAKLARIERQLDYLTSGKPVDIGRAKQRDMGRADVLRLLRERVPGGTAICVELLQQLDKISN